MIEYSAVVVNYGVHPSESLIKGSGSSRGILLNAPLMSLRNRGFHVDYLGHAHKETDETRLWYKKELHIYGPWDGARPPRSRTCTECGHSDYERS